MLVRLASLASPRTCPPSRNPYNSSTRRDSPLSFFRGRNSGSERFDDLRKVTQLGGSHPAQPDGGPPRWGGAPRVPLAFELLHDLQEAVVSGRVAAEADFHLVQVGEGVLHLRGGGGSRWAGISGRDGGQGSLGGMGAGRASEGPR